MNIENSDTCGFDSVTLFDGQDDNAAIIAMYCEDSPPSNVDFTTNNLLYVAFESDGSVSGRGFTIQYEAVDASQGQYQHADSSQAETSAQGMQLSLAFTALFPNSSGSILVHCQKWLRHQLLQDQQGHTCLQLIQHESKMPSTSLTAWFGSSRTNVSGKK